MSDAERLEELLLEWEDYYERGRDPTPQELCRTCPELAEELAREIAKLKRLRPQADTLPSAPPDRAAPAGAFAGLRYRPLRHHASGGLGDVFVAADDEVGREVALKRIKPGRAHSPDSRQRFRREAEITGRLEHPGVVPVYGIGQDATGQPFYAMRLVRGRTLADAIAEYHRKPRAGQAGPLEQRELLGAFVGVCNTLAYAHSRGVVHRDLKPANVVLGEYGEVIVLDWGLAKALPGGVRAEDGETEGLPGLPAGPPEEGATDQTAQGQVLGTPAYMAPEQAEGRLEQIDRRTDVYGLGATLYEVLTGRPPFAGADAHELLRRVREGSPPAPRAQAAGVPRALEAVCLKAMARRPEDRYASAGELAEEVKRWLSGEPVKAWPEPWPVRARRWLGRHRTLVAALASGAGIALVGAVAGLAVVGRKNRDLSEVNAALGDANTKLTGALGRETDARRQAQDSARQAREARDAERATLYVTSIGLAQDAYANGQLLRTRDLLRRFVPRPGETDLRGFEWHYLWRLARGAGTVSFAGHKGSVLAVRYSADGARVWSAGRDGTVKVWDAATGRLRKSIVLNEGVGGTGLVVRERKGRIVVSAVSPGGAASALDPPPRPGDEVRAVSGPDGKMVPTAGKPLAEALKLLRGPVGSTVTVEVLRAGRPRPERHTLTRRPLPAGVNFHAVWEMTFSPDGTLLATAGPDDFTRLWDAAGGRLKFTLKAPQRTHGGMLSNAGSSTGRPIRSLSFSPDGRLLATVGPAGPLGRVWDTATGTLKAQLRPGPLDWAGRGDGVAFLPDGRSLVLGLGRGFGLWDVSRPDRPGSLPSETWVGRGTLKASPDGRWLASNWEQDERVLLYDLPRRRATAFLGGHQGMVRCLAFSPDGRLLATGGQDACVRLWRVDRACEVATLRGADPWVECVAFSPDGRSVVAGGGVPVAVTSSDSQALLNSLQGPNLVAWPVSRRVDLDLLPPTAGFSGALAFGPDGKTLTTGGHTWGGFRRGPVPASLEVWRSADGRRQAVLQEPPPSVTAVGYTDGGERLAVVESPGGAGHRGRVTFWDAKTRRVVDTVEEGGAALHAVALTGDGRHLAVCSGPVYPEQARLFEDTGGSRSCETAVYERAGDRWERRATLREPSGPAGGLVFTGDAGELVVVDRRGGAVLVWDWRRGKVVARLTDFGATIQAFALAPDSPVLALALGGRPHEARKPAEVRLCDWKTGRTLATLRGHGAAVDGLAFSPDGTRLASAGRDGTARVWDVAGKAEPLVLGHGGEVRVLAVAFAPDGRSLFTTWDPGDGTHKPRHGGLSRWDLSACKQTVLGRGLASPGALAVSPDAGTVVTGEAWSGILRLWDPASGKELAAINTVDAGKFAGHLGLVRCARVSPDGRLLATGGDDRAVRLWDRKTGGVLHTLRGHRGAVHALAFAADGGALTSVAWVQEGAAEKGEVIRWDVSTGKKLGSFALPPYQGVQRSAVPQSVAFSPDGRLLASFGTDNRSVRVWDVARGRPRPPLTQTPDLWAGVCVTFARDGRHLAAGGWDLLRRAGGRMDYMYSFRLWDLETGKLVRSWPVLTSEADVLPITLSVVSIALSPDGRTLAAGYLTPGRVELWHVATGHKLLELPGGPDRASPVVAVQFAPDGKALAAGSFASNVALYRAEEE